MFRKPERFLVLSIVVITLLACGLTGPGEGPADTTAGETPTHPVDAVIQPTEEAPAEDATETPAGITEDIIPFPSGEPINLEILLDDEDSAETEIGPDGGTLVLESPDGAVFELDVPAGALFSPVTIRMTRISLAAGLPFEDSSPLAVHFEPEGLHFLSAATFRLTPPEGVTVDELAPFATTAGGADFHLVPSMPGQDEIVILMTHFSSGGAALVQEGEVESIQERYTPSTGEGYAKNSIGVILESVEGKDAQADAIEVIMRRWFNTSVLVRLQNAASNDEFLDQAIGEYLAWKDLVEMMSVIQSMEPPLAERLADLNGQALDAMAAAIKSAFERAHVRCVRDNDPDQGLKMTRWGLLADHFELFGREGLDAAETKELIESCFQFEFKLRSKVSYTEGQNSVTSQVLSTVPLKLNFLGTAIARMENSGDLIVESFIAETTAGSANCDADTRNGTLKVILNLDVNPMWPRPAVEEVSVILIVEEPPREGCLDGVVDTTYWWEGYQDGMSPFLRGAGYVVSLPIVKEGSLYAFLELEGELSVSGASEEGRYELTHTPAK